MKEVNEDMNKDLSHYIESLECRKVNIETELETFEPTETILKLEEKLKLSYFTELKTIETIIQDLKEIGKRPDTSYWEYYPR